MNYNNYPPKGIDHKILLIQNALKLHLGFVGVDFYGRVLKTLSKDGNSFVPEVHVSHNERKEVFYDDVKAPGGNVFFIDNDDHVSKDGKLFTAKVKIVFMLNLDKLFPNTTYRADSEVQDKCFKLVEKIKVLEITGLEKGLKNVLKDFDITTVKTNDLQPYHTFSINGDLKYTFNARIVDTISNVDPTDPVIDPTPIIPPVTCNVPVITPFTNNQFTNAIYITKGVDTYFQIQASNNPTSYSYFVSFLANVEGISLNTQTGLFTVNYVGNAETITVNFTAENTCGPANSGMFLKPVDTDVNTLLPPINLTASGYNPHSMGPSFMLGCKFLPYMAGTISKVEYWKDDVLCKTFQNEYLGNVLGENGDLMQQLEYGGNYNFKIRVGNTLGEFSEFSEVINVTIPIPNI